MNPKLAFRCLLLLDVVLGVVVLPATVALSPSLPRDLTRYLETLSAIPLEGPAAWLLPALEVAAILGLFFFVRGARELYLVMIGVSLAHAIFEGVPAVLPGATYVAVQAERIVTGLIIGLAFGSPIASLLSIRRTQHRRGRHAEDQSTETLSNNEMQRTSPAVGAALAAYPQCSADIEREGACPEAGECR